MELLPHVLIVGGTGMLAEVCASFAEQGHLVSVLARTPSRLFDNTAKRILPRHLNLIATDYCNSLLLKENVEQAVHQYGPIRIVVAWIHGTAPDAPLLIANIINEQHGSCDYFHILGSSYADPSRPDENENSKFNRFQNLRYHRVILGFKMDGERSRWLTDQEISSGVLIAVQEKSPTQIVGTVEPWSARP